MSAEMLSCRELIHLVTEYFEGALSAEERMRFERHIAICPPCRSYLAQMRTTRALAGELTEESISPEAREHLLSAFRDWRADR